MQLQVYPTGVEKVPVKKISEGRLHSCSGLVREWAKG